MRLPIWAINQDVVEKHQYEFPHHIPENCIHESLKHGQSIHQSERHYWVLIMPLVSSDCRLMDALLSNADLMVLQVKHRKESRPMKLIQQLINNWDQKFVGYCGFV